MAEFSPTEGSGSDAEELAEHRARRTPDRVAHEIEEDDLAVVAVEPPSFLALMGQQLGDRDVEDGLDLVGAGPEVGAAGERYHVGDDERVAHHGGEVIELTDGFDEAPVEGDLLLGLAQCGGEQVLTGILSATGEGDLPPVHPEMTRSSSEHDPELALVFVETGEDGRRLFGEALARGAHRGPQFLEAAGECVEVEAPLPRRQLVPGRGFAGQDERGSGDVLRTTPFDRGLGGHATARRGRRFGVRRDRTVRHRSVGGCMLGA